MGVKSNDAPRIMDVCDDGFTCVMELGQNLNVTALVAPEVIDGPAVHQSKVMRQVFDKSGHDQDEEDGKNGHYKWLGWVETRRKFADLRITIFSQGSMTVSAKVDSNHILRRHRK
jgi:hypothetical protein